MKSDIEIARAAKLEPITAIAKGIGLGEDDIETYGKYKAKILLGKAEPKSEDSKLILVTAINPTPAGEGKTTVTAGLGQAFAHLGKKAIIALREPSLGPVFGIKGGAAGGGYSQVVPMEDINLHFTGDFHAITSANNLISALLDNHIKQGNELNIDIDNIIWKRCLDINDRVLRNVIVGLGETGDGVERGEHFTITAASEIMAILCLSKDLADLRKRLEKITIAYNIKNEPVTLKDLGGVGAVMVLLKDAVCPNLVQTLENTPAIIHGGPFANIAHGCNSIIATRMAMKLADITITEAGFGADLGAEKFLDIACRYGDFWPDAVVIVATIRAIKYHGGVIKGELLKPDADAVDRGFLNLKRHIENIKSYGLEPIVALNTFLTDEKKEQERVVSLCESLGILCILSDTWGKGGKGGIDLAKALSLMMENGSKKTARYCYSDDLPLSDKITAVAKKIYGAEGVDFSDKALKSLDEIEKMGYKQLPVCIAKTQYSFSDDPKKLGAPEGFRISIREAYVLSGAGFVVALSGQILTMPGLGKSPMAMSMDLAEDFTIVGLS